MAAGPVDRHDPLATAFQRAANNLRDALRWRYAAVLGLRVPPPARMKNGRPAWPPELADRSFAELPDPFTPRMRIWLLGYALDKVDAGGVELVALAPLLK